MLLAANIDLIKFQPTTKQVIRASKLVPTKKPPKLNRELKNSQKIESSSIVINRKNNIPQINDEL